MISVLSMLIFVGALLGLAFGFGLLALPWLVSLVIAAPAIFIYMLALASILWLAEIHILLGLAAAAIYVYWLHIIQKHIKAAKAKNLIH